jgi:hypothetical protein
MRPRRDESAMQSRLDGYAEDLTEDNRMESEMVITGAIVDSWVESAQATASGPRLVLQVAPRGRPKDLVIVEAEPSLVPDRFWLEDLSENLCHGSPVQAIGRPSYNGFVAATRLQLAR